MLATLHYKKKAKFSDCYFFGSLTNREVVFIIAVLFFMTAVFPPLLKPKPLRPRPRMYPFGMPAYTGKYPFRSFNPGGGKVYQSEAELAWRHNVRWAYGEQNRRMEANINMLVNEGQMPDHVAMKGGTPPRGSTPMVRQVVYATPRRDSSSYGMPARNLTPMACEVGSGTTRRASSSSYGTPSRCSVPVIRQVIHATGDRASSSNQIPLRNSMPEVIDLTHEDDVQQPKHRVPRILAKRQRQFSISGYGIDDGTYTRDLERLRMMGVLPPASSDDATSWVDEISKSQFADLYADVINSASDAPSSSTSIVYATDPVDLPALPSESLPSDHTLPTYDNVTEAYHSPDDAQLQETSPFLGDCYDVDTIEPSLFFDGGMFDAYRNSTEVVQDVSSSIIEQRESVFDTVIDKISNDNHSETGTMEWTNYDEPPTDDSYFSVIPTDSPSTSSGFVSSDSRSISPQEPNPKPSSDLRSISPQKQNPNPPSDSRSISPQEPNSKPSADSRSISPQKPNPEPLESRMEGKLVPPRPKRPIKTRGRRSRDDELISLYNLPISAEQLINMDHRQMRALLEDRRWTSTQRNMLKKIRRRGRNRLAAQRCRERRSISEVLGNLSESVVNGAE
uniref:BZIP domain-containing protein n=1 Tax=Panagrellus redivivus TaxID=6233 RepID=A0A7E4ZSN5_PANRE